MTRPSARYCNREYDDDEDQADQTGEEAVAQLLGAERGGDRVDRTPLERQRQRAELQLVGQRLGALLGERSR